MQLEDSLLLTASDPSARGDAWSATFVAEARASRTIMYAIARRICGDDAAADVVQEVLARVWRHADRFDPRRGTLRQYLMTVTRGVAVDHLRRSVATRTRDLTHALGGPGAPPDTDQAMLRLEVTKYVSEALTALTPSEREAIMAAFYEEMTYREVAIHLSIPEGTAKSRIKSGLGKLRAELHEFGHDDRPGLATG